MARGDEAKEILLPPVFPGHWTPVGRLQSHPAPDSVTLQDGFIGSRESWRNCDFAFRARAPEGTSQVQIWAGICGRDRDSRYIFGLRGGGDNDVYLARYAPDGNDKFLGLAPLDFKPQPGVWYKLRAVAAGGRFQIYLNDEPVPRINVVDDAPLWKEGNISLGGGWLPVEFRDVSVKEAPASASTDTQIWQPPGFDHEARRVQERAAYQPMRVEKIGPDRMEIPLDGKWLFMPEQDLGAGVNPLALDYADGNWHVIDVPALWTPCLSWLYGETGFKLGDGVASGKGISDQLFEAEHQRLDHYTFDWKHTRIACTANTLISPRRSPGATSSWIFWILMPSPRCRRSG